MIAGSWGSKIGMTQVFAGDKVIPVTVIDTANWLVTAFKTADRDGYDAVQLGRVKKRHAHKPFTDQWLKKPRQYFGLLREVRLEKPAEGLSVGKPIALNSVFSQGQHVDVVGTTRGLGFAGVMKRHGFSGGRASHGDKTGRRPGSIGNYCAEGKVVKGKKMPGHKGNVRRTIMNLEVVGVDIEREIVLVKGAVPGKTGSTLFIRKRGA